MSNRLVSVGTLAVCFALACGGGDDTSDADPMDKPDAGDKSDAGKDDGALGPTESSIQVRTTGGVVRGALNGTTRKFLGIPFGKAPVGELRWRSPEPAEPWDDERDATAFGPQCAQRGGSTNEDCLYLNVFTKDVDEADPEKVRPTMVWIHGGAFSTGASDLYDGTQLVEQGDIVFVSINYRLGALGFLTHPALSADPGGRGTSGNYGIEDQILALEWVHDNIRAFGGDPENVTVFGESAGSACTCVLLGTPGAKGLVHRAIMESGACLGFNTSIERAEMQGTATAEKAGCEGADEAAFECLHSKTPEQLVAASDQIEELTRQRWRPILDGVVIPLEEDIEPIRVPVIIGTNSNEGGPFGALTAIMSYEGLVRDLYPNEDDADIVLGEYSVENYGSNSAAFSAFVTDGLFVCPTRRLVRAVAAEDETAYLYEFAHNNPAHAAEIPYVFGWLTTEEEAMVSAPMVQAWTTFARTGDPNGDDADPVWPKYDTDADEHMIFDVEQSIGSGLKQEQCDLLDMLPPPTF